MSDSALKKQQHFIRKIIEQDLSDLKYSKLVTRFPPEPNGYLHIGHAKAICLNFELAKDYNGECFLRFDDTNPANEEEEYIKAIQKDVSWLGYDWHQEPRYTSDHFNNLYDKAELLIKKGKAYVDSLTVAQMREYRGTLTEPGRESPDRNRAIEDNLDLFRRMRAGEFAEGQFTLRAKIDMKSGNINLRDPAIYRIRKIYHQRCKEAWCIFPMYDFSHALSDSLEGITHSLCTLEFQDHKPLYDWFVSNCDMSHTPKQIEFSRLNLNYTITSKRKLKRLVDDCHVNGWDDPRMPTLSGMRRRGIPPEAIRSFCEKVGISKQDSVIDINLLEAETRDFLNIHTERRMAILKPIKVIITNYPEHEDEILEFQNHPQDKSFGCRNVKFSREILIDSDDFTENPSKNYFRLFPGGEVRLRGAYAIRCCNVIKNDEGKIIELHCQYDADTLGGKKPKDGRKIKGVVHWLNAGDAVNAKIRVYKRLFSIPNPTDNDDLTDSLTPDSLNEYEGMIEPALAETKPERRFQFMRIGYFVSDCYEHNPRQPTFNQIVTLKESKDKV